jgi:hypothetical protein
MQIAMDRKQHALSVANNIRRRGAAAAHAKRLLQHRVDQTSVATTATTAVHQAKKHDRVYLEAILSRQELLGLSPGARDSSVTTPSINAAQKKKWLMLRTAGVPGLTAPKRLRTAC